MSEFNLDIQEISLDDNSISKSKEISLNNDIEDINYGSSSDSIGLGLLMNPKIKDSKGNNTSTNSLNNLEKELSEIDNNVDNEDQKEIKYDKNNFNSQKPKIEIAKSTSLMENVNETWDGLKDINTINIEDAESKTKKMTAEQLLKEKFEILRKLERLEDKGATLSKKYNMDSDLQEMQGEYEFLINEKEKSNSIKFQGKVLTTLITGLEFLNGKFDPFDIKLDGWSEQINENIDDFDEIFSELHEKYKSKAKMAPEIKLLFQLASSGIMIHMTNTMFKSALPGMDDIMRQNPDLMNHFTKAAMSSMESKTPGLSNFMNDFGMSHSQQEPRNMRSTPQSYEEEPKPQMRQDMKGPSNIDNLLNNLNKNSNSKSTSINLDKDSTISIDDIDNISLASGNSTKKQSKRKNSKNTISLAI